MYLTIPISIAPSKVLIITDPIDAIALINLEIIGRRSMLYGAMTFFESLSPLSLETYVEYVTALPHSDFVYVRSEKHRRKYVRSREKHNPKGNCTVS